MTRKIMLTDRLLQGSSLGFFYQAGAETGKVHEVLKPRSVGERLYHRSREDACIDILDTRLEALLSERDELNELLSKPTPLGNFKNPLQARRARLQREDRLKEVHTAIRKIETAFERNDFSDIGFVKSRFRTHGVKGSYMPINGAVWCVDTNRSDMKPQKALVVDYENSGHGVIDYVCQLTGNGTPKRFSLASDAFREDGSFDAPALQGIHVFRSWQKAEVFVLSQLRQSHSKDLLADGPFLLSPDLRVDEFEYAP